MRLRDIKDASDLRDMSSNDVADLVDELRAIATKRGTELLQQGRVQARKAIGAPDPGSVGSALVIGLALGAAVGAVVAMLMTPMRGRDARQRLAHEAERMKERMPEMRVSTNGKHAYPAHDAMEPPMPASTARPMA